MDVIYFAHDGALQVMAPGGSGKTSLLEGYVGPVIEPSYELHGGGRWFLKPVGSELIATKDDGTTVMLLGAGDDGDWDVEHSLVRWVKDGEIRDGRVSWVSSRMDGETEQFAIVRATLIYDSQTGDIAGLDLESIERFEGLSQSYDWSPDGTMIAFTDADLGALWVFDTLTQNFQLLAADWVWLTPAWSPDGSRIAYVANDTEANITQLKTIHLINGTVTLIDEGQLSYLEGTRVYAADWSPDSSQLVYEKYSSAGNGQNHDIVVRNANGKGKTSILTKELDTWSSLPAILGWRAE